MQVEDPGAFYGATATILSAVLITGLLELRWYREFLSGRGGRPPLVYRVMLTVFAVLLGVAALTLGSIPNAALNGPSMWFEDPELLVSLTSGVVIVAIVLPLGTYLSFVWIGIGTGPPSPVQESTSKAAPTSRDATNHCVAGSVVAVAATLILVQRFRKAIAIHRAMAE